MRQGGERAASGGSLLPSTGRCDGLWECAGMGDGFPSMPAGGCVAGGARAAGAAEMPEKGTVGTGAVGKGHCGKGSALPGNGKARGLEGQEQQRAAGLGPEGRSSPPLSNMDMVWLANIATRNARKAS